MLTPSETSNSNVGREWERFVAGLRPNDTLPSKLKSFRFPSEPAQPVNDDEAVSLAHTAVALILSNLEKLAERDTPK